MKVFSGFLCICPNCGTDLHYRLYSDPIYTSSDCYCGECGASIKEAVYGKEQIDKYYNKKNEDNNQNPPSIPPLGV